MNKQESALFSSVEAVVVEALDGKRVSEFVDFEGFSAWIEVVMAYDAFDYACIDESSSLAMLQPVYEKLISDI